MNAENPGTPRPVTATITQTIDPACENAYEALLSGIQKEAEAFDGFLRREVIKSAAGPHLEYSHVIHFDNETNLRRWQHSSERHKWLSRMSSMAVRTTPLKVLTGLETWFTLSPGESIVPPPRYKMAIITWLAIFPLITLMSYALQPILKDLPIVVRTMAFTLVLVPLMTYLVMPRMTRLFEHWLYPRRASVQD